jgi:hypothetical protein
MRTWIGLLTVNLLAPLVAFAQQVPPVKESPVLKGQGQASAAAAVKPVPENAAFRENRSRLVLRVDYEGGTLASAGRGVVADGPSAKDSFSVSDQNPRSGKFCLRTKVANSDDYVSYGAHRAETWTSRLAACQHNEGDVFRYQLSFRLQEDWQFDTRDSVDIIWQFKRFDGGPDMFVGVKGRAIVLRCGSEGQWTLVENCQAGNWMDLCLIVRWSTGPDGGVEAFSKCAAQAHFKKEASFYGPNMRDARPDSTYLKWGIYKPDMKASTANKPRVIYHDDIIVEKMVSPVTH